MGLLTDNYLATNQLEKLEPTKAARLTGQCSATNEVVGKKSLIPYL